MKAELKSPPKEQLLARYKAVWDKVDAICHETDAICQTSAYGQAPPVFHELVDQQMAIIKKEAEPIWDELRRYIRDGFETFWQHTRWMPGCLPPHYNELHVLETHNPNQFNKEASHRPSLGESAGSNALNQVEGDEATSASLASAPKGADVNIQQPEASS